MQREPGAEFPPGLPGPLEDFQDAQTRSPAESPAAGAAAGTRVPARAPAEPPRDLSASEWGPRRGSPAGPGAGRRGAHCVGGRARRRQAGCDWRSGRGGGRRGAGGSPRAERPRVQCAAPRPPDPRPPARPPPRLRPRRLRAPGGYMDSVRWVPGLLGAALPPPPGASRGLAAAAAQRPGVGVEALR